MNLRFRAKVNPEPEGFILSQKTREGTPGVIGISEYSGVYRTGSNAGRSSFRVHSRRQVLSQSSIDPVAAEGAFFNHTPGPAFDFSASPGGMIGIFLGLFAPIETPDVIGAGNFAVPAANAAVIIHGNQTIFPDPGCTYRTNFDAGSFRTMQAGTGHEEIRSAFCPLRKTNIPAHIIIRDIIGCLAGPDTVLAANAGTEIDCHIPAVFGLAR